MTQLHEKYRPKTWAEVIGQDKAVRKLQHPVRARKLEGFMDIADGN